MKTAYRPDIDGLRAVAVLSVVFYHLHAALVPGGYVGVDIFFVISGYLITRIIWNEADEGRFSFANFYLRRIRRIAPAFLVVVAATLAAGALLLLPDDLARLARSATWSALSLGNVYFWKFLDVDYFAAASAEEPLLHLWSLGVEEQFYMVWPALILVATLFRRRRIAALTIAAVACVASFWNAQATLEVAQKWAYYMLPARGGELMLGALLAILRHEGPGRLPLPSRNVAEGLALVGFALIGGALWGLDDSSAFPGINAFWPCLGAVLLIYAGEAQSRVVHAVLARKAMVFVGLVSYSLYLWHWPILAFLRYFHGEIGLAHGAFALVAMGVLTVLSYRYVETPARNWRPRPRTQAWALFGLPSMAIILVSLGLVWTGGFKARIEGTQAYRDGLARVERDTAPAMHFPSNCQGSQYDPRVLSEARCVLPKQFATPAPGLLLWGDSQAAHYLGVIEQLARHGGFSFRNATFSTCPPVFGGRYGTTAFIAGCGPFRRDVEAAVRAGAVRTVVMSGAWSIYDRQKGFRADFERTVDTLRAHGVDVVLIGQVPYFGNYNRSCELRGMRIGGVDCQARYTIDEPRPTSTERYLEDFARKRGLPFLDVRDVLCRDGKCSPYLDGHLVYYNPTHLSLAGSTRIGDKLLASPARAPWLAAIDRDAATPMPGAARKLAAATGSSAGSAGQAAFVPRRATLLDGYSPSFPHHVRSEKTAATGTGPRGVVLETWGGDATQIMAALRRDLGAKGFKETSERPHGAATQLVFEKAGAPRVVVSVGPLGALRAQAPNASGMVYIRW